MKRNTKNKLIQKEQMQLVKIQKELKAALGKVNESINALKVEELHLKSTAVTAMKIEPTSIHKPNFNQPSTSATAEVIYEECSKPEMLHDFEALINSQTIDLNLFTQTNVMPKSNLEEEDDSD